MGLLAFVAYVIAAVIFFLVGNHNIVPFDQIWGFFAIAVGLALGYVPAAYAKAKSLR